MKNIVIKGWMVAVAIFVVMFGGIYLTIGTGHWTTTRDSEPVRLDSGEYDPADIRGSYTYSEIEEFFGVPADVLFNAFMIPENLRQPDFQVKSMEDLFAPVEIDGVAIEVGTDLVRTFTSFYTGLPYESEETTYMPMSAVKALIEEQKLNAEQQAYWQAHTFELVLTEGTPEGEIVAVEEHEEEGEVSIKGGTTMGELVQYGLTKEQFKEITGIDMPGSAVGLRDFVTQNGLDMETVKTALEELLLPATDETVSPKEPTETIAPAEEQPEATIPDIKGSTSIGTLLGLGLTPEQFKTITGLDVPDDPALMLRDFAETNGLDMETIKTQILEALASTPDEETVETETLTTEATPVPAESEPQADTQPSATTIDIKGSTSIGTLLEAGLTPEQFKEITGLDVPNDATMRLKDFADANGLDMETIRTQLIDALAQ